MVRSCFTTTHSFPTCQVMELVQCAACSESASLHDSRLPARTRYEREPVGTMEDTSRRNEQQDSASTSGDRPPGSTGPLINWEEALEMTAGDESLLAEVIGAFQEEAPKLMANMQAALAARDAELLHRAAHTLKNAFNSLGAPKTGDLGFELEKVAKEGDFERAAPLLARVKTELHKFTQETDQYLRNRGQAGG